MTVYDTLNSSFITYTTSRLTVIYIFIEDPSFLISLTSLSSIPECNLPSVVVNLTSVNLCGGLIDAIQVLRAIQGAQNAVLSLKFICIPSTSKNSAEQSNCGSTVRAILLRHFDSIEVIGFKFNNLMTFFVFIYY